MRACKTALCRVECVCIFILCCIILLYGCGDGFGTEHNSSDTPAADEAAAVEAGTGKEPDAIQEPKEKLTGIIVVNEAAGETEREAVSETDPAVTDTAEYRTDENEDDKAGSTADENTEDAFYITEITDEIFERIYGLSFKEDCTLPREDLRYLHLLHKDKDGNVLEGEMIVNVHIAQDVLDILKELYENGYPIEKIRLVDEYGADDEASMEDNNSSCFNFRTVPGSKKMSKHSMGLAIDINTRYNPYVRYKDGQSVITPVNGIEYADRDTEFDYKIEKGDLCYELFTAHGFAWGGEWKNSKDYQHFEIPDPLISGWYR